MSETNPMARAILRLLAQRSEQASLCPSEVARHLASDEGDWRGLMPAVRQAAAHLAAAGTIRVTQGEQEVDIQGEVRGPVRLRRGATFDVGER